jgi:hypothetical protein
MRRFGVPEIYRLEALENSVAVFREADLARF